MLQIGLVLVGLSSVLRGNHQGATKGQVVLGKSNTLTLSLPRVPKIKIQDESQVSFCQILKYK